MMEHLMIPDVALVDNSEQRTPLILVLDSSGSMYGQPIQQLNEGLKLLEQELKNDVIAAKRVRILVIEYGGYDQCTVHGDWKDAMDFTAPVLEANGTTPMGQAITLALEEIEAEKQRFKQAGVAYTRPWLFLMSDGVPTDQWEQAAQLCRQAEESQKTAVFPIMVDGASAEVMGCFSRNGVNGVKMLKGLQFKELFLWLSASMQVVSQSTPGGTAQLPSTDSWASVPV
ncbi:VWA domain-containing protein [Proteus terrae subsp. cibarius]|uniref:VWA domain-containing protein n=2 Tax=Morganellaceae TaxID=1903414 RepID=A0A6I6G0D4_9GAMM|nr:VWA domain-containing protein [Proteus terrae subsp. cibarius]UXA35016.1 VWA domain-containing protein [Proteus terrae]MBG3089184.1 VWA domain-containing protein [Proteus terrae subsp. cibarius]QGW02105.1 VWA domain-containing protein [Proteus terrae subsp. cibarius]QHD94768.1 VWA domain-containing protein [Proteus terrae subsp. cibarius]